MRRRESNCDICIKIYKKSMLAIAINVVVMVILIIQSNHNIRMLKEEQFVLINHNITSTPCAIFCESYQIDKERQCCNLFQKCMGKDACLKYRLDECQQDIQDYQEVTTIGYIILAICGCLSLGYFLVRAKQVRRNRELLLQLLLQARQEHHAGPQYQINEGQQWEDYVQTNNSDQICAVCHQKMSMTRVAELQCKHVFHSECIRQWFSSRDEEANTCPICRQIN